jgi:hypothetical protein
LGHGISHPPPASAKAEEKVMLPLLPHWAFMEGYRLLFTDVKATNIAHIKALLGR